MSEYYDDYINESDEEHHDSQIFNRNNQRTKKKYELRRKIDDYFYEKSLKEYDEEWYTPTGDTKYQDLH